MKILALLPVLMVLGAMTVFSQSPPADKLELGGDLQGEWSLLGIRLESPLYRLRYFGTEPATPLFQYGMTLHVNGDYQSKDVGAHIRTLAQTTSIEALAFTLMELYGEFYFSDSFLLFLGKKSFIWGKGYAFSTVNFAGRSKDPEDPELALEGTPSLGLEYSRGFPDGILSALFFGLYILPTIASATPTADDILNTVLAGRMYVLFWDTDIDLFAQYGRNKPIQFGADMSRNITPEIELHAEISYSMKQPRYTIAGATLVTAEADNLAFLAGLRWLSPWNMTVIFEYYHNSAGLSRDEFSAYAGYMNAAAASGISAQISQALGINNQYFRTTALLTDYLYLKMTQPEPFGLVDFSVSAYSIFNVIDASLTAGMILTFQPATNIEFSLQPAFMLGPLDTEFGSNQRLYAVTFKSLFSF